jgi:hypothetical protein
MSKRCTSCNLKQTRTYSALVNSDQSLASISTPTAVSENGKYVLYGFTNFGPIPGATGPLIGGIIYAVTDCGVLTPLVTVSPDPGYDNQTVVTNSKFKLFFSIEEVTSNNATTSLLIKPFTFQDGLLTPTGKTATINNVVNLNINGSLLAQVTPDSKYLVVEYNTTTNTTTSLGDGVISVFDAETLQPLGTTVIRPGSPTQIAVFSGAITAFGLRNKCGNVTDYVAVSTGLGTITPPSNFVSAPMGPFTVQIYKVSGAPKLIETLETPQFVNTSVGYQPKCSYPHETLILTTSRAAILPTDNSIAVDTTASTSFIPGDNRNLRIYKFNGKNAELVIAEKFEYGIVGSTFAPDGRTFALSTLNGSPFNIPAQLGTTQIYRICERESGCWTIEPLGKFTAAGPSPASPFFSTNGRYLFEGWSAFFILQNDGVSPAFKNVSVLRLGGDCVKN